MAAFLNRALSEKTAPSPPYRFLDIIEFHQRLENLRALTNPTVEHVGKILLDRPPGSDSFSTDEDVVFSCTIGCSSGVETHEEIACGLAVFDREKDERIRDLGSAYTVDRHPSGRHRFGFRLSDLPPGSYSIRVAFKIRESNADPKIAEGRFELRAAPGYVPPRPRPTRRPIPMERPEPDPVTQTRTSPGLQAVVTPQTPEPEPGPRAPQPPPQPFSQQSSQPDVTHTAVRSTPPPVRMPPPRTPTITGVTTPPRQVAPVITDEDREDHLGANIASLSLPETGPTARSPGVRLQAQGSNHDAFDEEPVYENTGSWSQEIPIPRTSPGLSDDGEDIYRPLDPDEPTDEGTDEVLPGPIGIAIERLFEVLRGDAYVMFIGGAAVVMILLLILLFALN
jgi:hypothetical protein